MPKRVNFISIQHGHGIACPTYQVSPTRTGFEQNIVNDTTDMFAQTARQKGRVVSRTDKGIIVEYEDGTQEGFEIGRRYGSSGSLTFPHDLHCDLKEGDVFEVGQVLFYDTNFFTPDYLYPGSVAWKSGLPTLVALMERDVTYEDSSAITQEYAQLTASEVLRVVPVVVSLSDTLHQVAKVGDTVTSQTALLVVEDDATAGAGLYDEQTLATLRELSAESVRAKYDGKIDHIEVFYNGEFEDMSDSVAALCSSNDARLETEYRARGEEPLTGEVDEGIRIDGEPLMPGMMVIRFYISSFSPSTVGDKFVFGNQLKTIVGKVFDEPLLTESGVSLGGLFGAMAVRARIVESPYIMGMSNILSRVAGKAVVNAYRGKL